MNNEKNYNPAFEKNPKLGLISADGPSFFEHFYGPTYITERDIWPDMQEIWQKIDFENFQSLLYLKLF